MKKSAEYYASHPDAAEKKKSYDKEFEKKPSQVEKRVELNRANRKHDEKFGKGSRKGKDLSHVSGGLKYKPSSVNRGSKSDQPGDVRARGGKKK